MGLGITPENEIYTVLSIPLEWEDNDTLAYHFRALANEIMSHNTRILTVRLSTPVSHHCSKPFLELVCFSDHYENK